MKRGLYLIVGLALASHAQTYGLTSNWLGGFEIEQPEEQSCASMSFARALTVNMPDSWKSMYRGHRVSYRALYRMAQEAMPDAAERCRSGNSLCLRGNTLKEVLRLVQTYGVPILPDNPDHRYKTYAQTCADLESGSALFVRFKSYEWLIRNYRDLQDDVLGYALDTLANDESRARKPSAPRMILGIDATVRIDKASGTLHNRHTLFVRKSTPNPKANWDFSTWFDTDEYVGPHPILVAGYSYTQFGEPAFMVSDSKYSRPGFMEQKDFTEWHLTGRDIPDALFVRGITYAPTRASLLAYRSACRSTKTRAAFDDLDRSIANRHQDQARKMKASSLPIYPGY